ncbi:MAG: DsbC family protein [Pseudomonadota bacterium]
MLAFCVLGVHGQAVEAGSTAEGDALDAAPLIAHLQSKMPNLRVKSVSESPVAGVFLVDLGDAGLVYATADGHYLFAGDLYATKDEFINLTENRRMSRRAQLLGGVPRGDMVVFSPVGETKDYVQVFTDVDCGYCRKLHLEVPALNAMGIEVRYLAYPRAGLGTPSYTKIASAWCAKNPEEALTAVKAGQVIPAVECENPIASQFDLGRKVGVSGTPAIITSSGLLLPGYMPAGELAKAIGLDAG